MTIYRVWENDKKECNNSEVFEHKSLNCVKIAVCYKIVLLISLVKLILICSLDLFTGKCFVSGSGLSEQVDFYKAEIKF